MRTITVSVQDEIMQLSSNNAGAAGSYGVVTLEISFGNGWEGMTKKLYFYDAYGENLVYILLGETYLKEGETDVYEVPIPAEPLAYEGDMTLTIKGVDGTDAVIYTASKKLKVLNSAYSEGGSVPAEPTADQVAQLQAGIDAKQKATIISSSEPSATKVGVLGQLYWCRASGKMYLCTYIYCPPPYTTTTYEWTQIN